MKKLALGCLLLVLAFGTITNFAQEDYDLTQLAKYVPVNTIVYASIRSDDAYLDTLDALATDVTAVIPLGLPDGGLKGALDEALQPFGGYEGAREWLGNTAAIAQMNLSGSPIVLIEVSDIEKATDAVNEITELAGNFDLTETALGLLFTSSSSAILLTDDALLIEQSFSGEFFVGLPEAGNALSDDETFRATVAQLPESNYNALVYGNAFSLLGLGMTMGTPADASMDEMMGTLVRYVQGFGATVMGFTILDERNLTVDIAQTISDASAIEPLLPFFTRPAVSLAFAENIPADAQLLIHSTDFGTVRQLAFDAIKSVGEYIDIQYDNDDLPASQEPALLLDDAITFNELAFKGMTGQTMADAFGWMTGDFAVYNSLSFDGSQIGVTANLTVANTDGAQATRFVDGIAQLLNDTNIPFERENDELTLSSLTELAEVAATSPLPLADNNLNITLGANDNVLTFGTYPTAHAVLGGDFLKLADDATFQNITSFILPNANTVLYVNLLSLNDVATQLNGNSSAPSPLELMESMSGSMATSDSAITIRLVLTLK